jgi:uncharacterized protein GlcG (DUF336 family)
VHGPNPGAGCAPHELFSAVRLKIERNRMSNEIAFELQLPNKTTSTLEETAMKKTMLGATVTLAMLCNLPPTMAGEALISFKVLAPETALELAQATLKACSDKGYQVAVAVVDRSGIPQVMLRDRYAGAHTPGTATRKAWTATSFRTDTLALAEETLAGKSQSGVRFVENALMLGGGVLVEAGGSLVGAVGVSGAPSGELDDACARAGVAAIEEKLM